MTQIPQAATDAIHRAISDPGSITPRRFGEHPETLTEWQTRAVTAHAAPHIAAAERQRIRQQLTTKAAELTTRDITIHNQAATVLRNFAHTLDNPAEPTDAEPGEHDTTHTNEPTEHEL